MTGYTFPIGTKTSDDDWEKIAWIREISYEAGGFSQPGKRTIEVNIEYHDLEKSQNFVLDFSNDVSLDTEGRWIDGNSFELIVTGTAETTGEEIISFSNTVVIEIQ